MTFDGGTVDVAGRIVDAGVRLGRFEGAEGWRDLANEVLGRLCGGRNVIMRPATAETIITAVSATATTRPASMRS